jgi:HPt (histidine-containing phosphotransfer) domain-containing protein
MAEVTGSGKYDKPTPVRPEPCLAHLALRYLSRRQEDADAVERALANDDHRAVQSLGHTMRGSGAGYGFDGITEIGARLEESARACDFPACREALADLRAYLRNVVIATD